MVHFAAPGNRCQLEPGVGLAHPPDFGRPASAPQTCPTMGIDLPVDIGRCFGNFSHRLVCLASIYSSGAGAIPAVDRFTECSPFGNIWTQNFGIASVHYALIPETCFCKQYPGTYLKNRSILYPEKLKNVMADTPFHQNGISADFPHHDPKTVWLADNCSEFAKA